ncbi:MAG: hypothetical protein EZS28_036365 [Streblomastix strix]|uniref:Uncharacterized protein n=1 Tax=Streblomastix strix TaxID=222440 RepID=A0A5J4UC76_9EUKA|nr:MAG: hypothetical protein EZS28_036365 [Streblomastix strix]
MGISPMIIINPKKTLRITPTSLEEQHIRKPELYPRTGTSIEQDLFPLDERMVDATLNGTPLIGRRYVIAQIEQIAIYFYFVSIRVFSQTDLINNGALLSVIDSRGIIQPELWLLDCVIYDFDIRNQIWRQGEFQ